MTSLSGCASNSNWRTASRESMGIAPTPEEEPRAIVQVYAARAFGWRGSFAVHTWIATKEEQAATYTTYHVTAWGLRSSDSTIMISQDIPDRRWYGADAYLVTEIRGDSAKAAIPKIIKAAKDYPNKSIYRAYPGPNSNTFISYILRRTPEISVELPPHAIGKDWIEEGSLFAFTESGTGVQFSTFGLFGFSLGLAEGLEVNLLAMTFGIDLWRPALKLPFVGRVGFQDAPAFQP
jgi:hypothetical protein